MCNSTYLALSFCWKTSFLFLYLCFRSKRRRRQAGGVEEVDSARTIGIGIANRDRSGDFLAGNCLPKLTDAHHLTTASITLLISDQSPTSIEVLLPLIASGWPKGRKSPISWLVRCSLLPCLHLVVQGSGTRQSFGGFTFCLVSSWVPLPKALAASATRFR